MEIFWYINDAFPCFLSYGKELLLDIDNVKSWVHRMDTNDQLN